MWTLTRNAAALILAALLGACGSHHDTSPATNAAAQAARKAQNPADALTRSMVAAVTSTKPGSAPIPVQVKFTLRQRPEVAQPLDIDIALVPTASNLDRIAAKVEGEEGLELVSPGDLEVAEKPTENTPIQRSLKVLPKHEGIFMLTATVFVDMGGEALTQTFTIPVIAGQAGADLPAKAPVAPAAAAQATQPAPTPASR